MISDSTTGVSSQTIKKLHDHIGHIGQAVESAVPSFVPVTSPPKPLKTPACAAIGRHVFSPLNTFPSSLQGAHVFGLFIDAKGSAPLQDSEGQHGDAPGPGLRDKYGSSSRYDWCVCVCVRVCRSQACYLATFPKYIILFSRVFICSDYISLYNYIYIPVYSARRTVTVAPFCCVALCWIIPDHSMDINVPYVNSACQATAISPIDLPCNLAVCYLSISTLSHSPSHHI